MIGLDHSSGRGRTSPDRTGTGNLPTTAQRWHPTVEPGARVRFPWTNARQRSDLKTSFPRPVSPSWYPCLTGKDVADSSGLSHTGTMARILSASAEDRTRCPAGPTDWETVDCLSLHPRIPGANLLDSSRRPPRTWATTLRPGHAVRRPTMSPWSSRIMRILHLDCRPNRVRGNMVERPLLFWSFGRLIRSIWGGDRPTRRRAHIIVRHRRRPRSGTYEAQSGCLRLTPCHEA